MLDWFCCRPLVGLLLGLFVGGLLEPNMGAFVCLVALVILFCLNRGMVRGSQVGCAILLGALLSLGAQSGREYPPVGASVLMGSHEVQGVVERVPGLREGGWVLRVRLSRPVTGSVQVFGKSQPPPLGRGARIQWRSRFKWADPRGRKGGLVAITSAPSTMTVLEEAPWGWKWSALARNRVFRFAREALEPRTLAWVCALGLGEPGLLSAPIRDRLRTLGLSHLLAVSGLHLTLVLGWVWLGVRGVQRVFRLSSIPGVRAIVCGLALLGYLALTPQSSATVRAFIFATAFLIATTLKERVDGPSLVSLAGIVLLMFDREAWVDPGTQLSFCGVVALMVTHQRMRRQENEVVGVSSTGRGWRNHAYLLLVAPWLGTMPLVAYWFGGFAQLAPLANGIGIPLTGLIILPLFLVVTGLCLLNASVLSSLAVPLEKFTETLEVVIVQLDHFLGLYAAVEFDAWMALLALVIAFVVLSSRGWRMRMLSLGVLLGGFGPLWNDCSRSPVLAHFINVGHGDATLLCGQGLSMVIDGGTEGDGWHSVLKRVRRNPCMENMHLVASHGDADHAGGLSPLVERLPIQSLMIGSFRAPTTAMVALLSTAYMRKVPVDVLSKGDRRMLGNMGWMHVLGPSKEMIRGALSSNDQSLVLQVHLPGGNILFTGDIEGEAERELQHSQGIPPPSLLKVAHHGSRTSTSMDFLQWSRPRGAVISHDPNRGHPHPEVLSRLQATVGSVWLTSSAGEEIVFGFDSSGGVVGGAPHWSGKP